MATHLTPQSLGEAKLTTGTAVKKYRWRVGFFTVMPAVILLLVITGFTRTLFARPLFHPAPIPPYLYLHGIVLTAWFVLFFVQSLLISAKRIQNHRRWGTIGGYFAIAVFCAALMASFGSVSRKPFDLNADASIMGSGLSGITVAQFRSSVVWGNIVNAVSFAVFIGAALYFRRRPQVHKRMMLLASISIVEPALARIARWPGLGGEQGPFIPIVVWSLIAAIAIYDVVSRKRPEACTVYAILFLLVVRNGAVWVSNTSVGLGLIYALR